MSTARTSFTAQGRRKKGIGSVAPVGLGVGFCKMLIQVPLSLRVRVRVRGPFASFGFPNFRPSPASPHPGPLPEGEGDYLRFPYRILQESSLGAKETSPPRRLSQ